LERESIGTFEELSEEATDPLRPPLGLGEPRERPLNLVDRADTDLVPVEETILEPRECLVGLLAGGPFVAESVDDGLKNREPAVIPVGLRLVTLFQERMDVSQELGFALSGHEYGRS